MSWTRIAVFYAVAGALGTYVYVSAGSRAAEAPPVTALAPIVGLSPSSVEHFLLEAGDVALAFQRDADQRWQLVNPPTVKMTSDTVEALIETLATIPPIEIVARDREADEEYGLARPAVVLSMADPAGKLTVVELGERSPTRTAVYARRRGAESVYLLGLNARYYADLLIQDYENKAGSGA